MLDKSQLSKIVIIGAFVSVIVLLIAMNRQPTTTTVLLDETTVTPEFIEHADEELDFITQYRSADVPDLPFNDNPDPTACGIPEIWGPNNNVAYLNGIFEGEMIQEIVLLYDSHSRLEVVAGAPHGTPVEIVMYQNNPVMDYYKVRIPNNPEDEDEGWIPAALISREPLIDT